MQHVTRRQALVTFGALGLATAGCGSTEPAQKGTDLAANRVGAMSSYGVGQQFKATKPLSLSVLYNNHPNYPIDKDWLFFSELTKRTGVTLEPTVVPLSDYENKRSLIIGAGDAPSIIPKTYPVQEEPFVASGAVLPVSDYLHLMPNFQDKVAKWNLKADLDTRRQADGRFYLLPGLHEKIWLDYSLAVRSDILQKLDLEVPTTWEEVRTMLTAMRAELPAGSYPFSDRWGVPTPGGNLLNMLGKAYGTNGGWDYRNATWDPAAGAFAFTGAMEQHRQQLQFLNTLVREKLLDPESFTQSDDDATQKFVSGKSFVIGANAQTLVNEYRPTLTKANPDAKVIKIPVPLGPLGNVKIGTRLENGLMISKKALESENFVAMMQFIDWLWYSDQGQEFAKWGVEGVTSTKDASGNFTLAADVDFIGLNPQGSKHLQKDFGFSNGVFAYGGTTKLLESTFSEEEVKFQKVVSVRKPLPVPPPHPFTEEEREQATLWETPLKDYVTQMSLKFILGERDLSEWDVYLKELETKNMSAYMNLVNTAYGRFKKEHG
jgi:putative aldouronate transport system substrate-binding protein